MQKNIPQAFPIVRRDTLKGQEIAYDSDSTDNETQVETPDRIHQILTSEQIEHLRTVFKEHPKQKLDYEELREVLEKVDLTFTDREYRNLFLKTNQNRDFKCDWDELISYLIFGFQEDDPSSSKEVLVLPIYTPPVIKKSKHRSAIVAINQLVHIPTKSDKNDDEEPHAIYLTASKDGMVRFWTSQLEPIRADMSESCFLKMPTWILAIEALTDVNIVCTSSTEREVRFHDSIASTFNLRVVIRSMPFAVCCMAYAYHLSGDGISTLCLGDNGGNVRILTFSPVLRGPFRSKPGTERVELFWSDILKNKYPEFKYREYLNYHSELIQQVYFSMRFNALVACAEYRDIKKYRGRCPGLVMSFSNEQSVFKIPLGVTSFYLDETSSVLATGGPDTYLRLWDPYIPHKPSALLTGHNAGIVMVFIQPEENKVYSIDYLRVIKVWHLNDHTLLQTYGDIARYLAGESDIVYFYNKYMRELLIGGRRILSLKCSPRMRIDLTDGNSHAASVSVVLYNRLFRNVVTCGLDSSIIVWDPWHGHRQVIMKNCHTRLINGVMTNVEITAACFDPLDQFLLTGARDGTLKVWNYNNAVCTRNMKIKNECEVTGVAWIVERIFATGWDRHITEFPDAEGKEYGNKKDWPTYHSDDITCACLKDGEGVATATYTGELILWRLETGQPYRRYTVQDPYRFLELTHKNKFAKEEKAVRSATESYTATARRSITRMVLKAGDSWSKSALNASYYFSNDDDETIVTDEERFTTNPVSVQALLFLQTRPMTKVHGSLLVALDNGRVQMYSHHQLAGYITSFNAIHKKGDCVLTMTTDRKNRYLFTGTALGYIKVWHIINYCIPKEEHTVVTMAALRLQFIFLWKERLMTPVKRIVRNQPEPMLLNSYKGHIKSIITMTYINKPHILITGSHDYSCRLWSLGGRYLGTLGSPLPWKQLSPFYPIEEYVEHRLPADIKKICSSTTLKVISGVYVDNVKLLQDALKAEEAEPDDNDDDDQKDIGGDMAQIYTKPLREPILGKHFDMPKRVPTIPPPKLGASISYIPVFTHVKTHDCKEIKPPKPSEVIRKTKEKNFMEFYQPRSK